jgi:hypothetical protein
MNVLSGHPLDHYKFELKHYGVTSVAEFNEFKEAVGFNQIQTGCSDW